MKVLSLESNGKENAGKKKDKIEARLAEKNQKMNSLNIKC